MCHFAYWLALAKNLWIIKVASMTTGALQRLKSETWH